MSRIIPTWTECSRPTTYGNEGPHLPIPCPIRPDLPLHGRLHRLSKPEFPVGKFLTSNLLVSYLAVLILTFYSSRVPLHKHPMDVGKLQNDLKAEALARQAVEVEAIKARTSEKANKGRSRLFVQLSPHYGPVFDLELRANQAIHLCTFTPGGLFVEAVDIQLQAFNETLLLASKCCWEIQPILELVWLDCESKCYLLITKLKNGK